MRLKFSSGILFGGIAVASLVLAGCATPGNVDDSGRVRVVASTDVYGDVAAQIGGDLIEVTSIIEGAAQDPHSYEATARDQLALSQAELVIENGGGYDSFIDTMLEASGDEGRVVVSAVEASGLLDGGDIHANDDTEHSDDDAAAHDHIEGFNEHVWYSLHGMENVAREIAHALTEIDEENATAYESNFDAFAAQLGALEEQATALRAQADGKGVAITEPVPVYLLDEIGLENRTPDAFSEAIEEGTDVPPAVLRETIDLFADDSVSLLAYNEQTAGAETEQVRAAAEDAGVAIVSLTETLPDGQDYLGWMGSNIDAIETALQ